MASFIAKIIGKRIAQESAKKAFGSSQDPYFEEATSQIEEDIIVHVDQNGRPISKTIQPIKKSTTYFGKKSKQKRSLPPGLTEKDRKILTKVKQKAYSLDCGFNICGFRFGWDALLSLTIVGKILSFYLALKVIRMCQEAKLPQTMKAKMYSNATIDFILGLVPLLGTILDVIFKCNTRNVILLESLLITRGNENLKILEGQQQQSGANLSNSDDIQNEISSPSLQVNSSLPAK